MTADSSDGNVQQNLGILRGEMSGVQKDIARVEQKVDSGFATLSAEIKALRDDRNFAKGAGWVITGVVAAAISIFVTFFARAFR